MCRHDHEHRDRTQRRELAPPRPSGGPTSVQTLLENTDERQARGRGPGRQVWPTGFDLLDSTLDGGLRSGELVLLGGSEGSGKTTIAVQMVRNAVAAGRHGGRLLLRALRPEPACSASSRSRRPPRPSRPGQHPAAAADVHTVRSVFEAEDPDRRGLADALARIPYGFDALDAVQRYAGRLQHARVRQGHHARRDRPGRQRGHRGGRGAPDRARRLPAEDAAATATSATRPRGSRSSPRR